MACITTKLGFTTTARCLTKLGLSRSQQAFSKSSPAHSLCFRAMSSKPTAADAQAMPREYYEFSNESLSVMAANGDQAAHVERLIRDIMHVDGVDWDTANATFKEIDDANSEGMVFFTLPYKVGITTAVVGGLASVPLCFDLNTALAFNEAFGMHVFNHMTIFV